MEDKRSGVFASTEALQVQKKTIKNGFRKVSPGLGVIQEKPQPEFKHPAEDS